MKHLLTPSLRGAQRRGNPLTILIIFLLLTSCTKKPQAQITQTPVESEVPAPSSATAKVDYDLSNMNFTMISSFFFQMLIEPETYENKTFKIKGKFQFFENEEDPAALPYFSVIMNDVTMCCQEGIDFQWQGEHNWPADYPEQDQEITILGKYIVSETDGITYNYILASDILL